MLARGKSKDDFKAAGRKQINLPSVTDKLVESQAVN